VRIVRESLEGIEIAWPAGGGTRVIPLLTRGEIKTWLAGTGTGCSGMAKLTLETILSALRRRYPAVTAKDLAQNLTPRDTLPLWRSLWECSELNNLRAKGLSQ
jgi:hypothetical protein